MPLQGKPTFPPSRICIFGDSHLASVSRALKAEPLLGGVEHEFWGADGPSFRDLKLANGRIVAGKVAGDVVATVNGKGRDSLAPDDFDGFLFYGARMRMSDLMPPLLNIFASPHGHISQTVLRLEVRSYVTKVRAYRFAQFFARTNRNASVVFAPTSLWTADVKPQAYDHYPFATQATACHRGRIRAVLDEIGDADGIRFIHQPEDTIVSGVLTDAAYGIDGAAAENDPVHKSPQYARLILKAYAEMVGITRVGVQA